MNKFRVLHLSTYDYGGAGIAAVRIHESMLNSGLDSILLARFSSSKSQNKYSFQLRPSRFNFSKFYEVLRRKISYNEKYNMFSIADKSTANVLDKIESLNIEPDIVVLHWIANFISLDDIQAIKNKYNCKIYWYAMDMALLTGGCHFSWECQGYETGCKKCPAEFLSCGTAANYFQKKINLVANTGIEAIASNAWVREQIRSSRVPFKNIHLAYLPIDSGVFKPPTFGNSDLKFGAVKIFFGAVNSKDKRKGAEYFLNALTLLNDKIKQSNRKLNSPIVVLPGLNRSQFDKEIPFPVERLDIAKSDVQLNEMYQKSDVFICTSIEDTGPMMVSESLMSGVPVIAFNMGVCAELITDGINGYVVDNKDSEALADKLYEYISKTHYEINEMKERARSSVVKIISTDAHTKQMISALSL